MSGSESDEASETGGVDLLALRQSSIESRHDSSERDQDIIRAGSLALKEKGRDDSERSNDIPGGYSRKLDEKFGSWKMGRSMNKEAIRKQTRRRFPQMNDEDVEKIVSERNDNTSRLGYERKYLDNKPSAEPRDLTGLSIERKKYLDNKPSAEPRDLTGLSIERDKLIYTKAFNMSKFEKPDILKGMCVCSKENKAEQRGNEGQAEDLTTLDVNNARATTTAMDGNELVPWKTEDVKSSAAVEPEQIAAMNVDDDAEVEQEQIAAMNVDDAETDAEVEQEQIAAMTVDDDVAAEPEKIATMFPFTIPESVDLVYEGGFPRITDQIGNSCTTHSLISMIYRILQNSGDRNNNIKFDIMDCHCMVDVKNEGISNSKLMIHWYSEGALISPERIYRDHKYRVLINRPIRLDDELMTIKVALACGYPVLCGLKINQVAWSVGVAYDKGIISTNDAGNDGHAVVIVGYDDDMSCYFIRNSWGEDWGNSGHGYLPYEFDIVQSWLFDSVTADGNVITSTDIMAGTLLTQVAFNARYRFDSRENIMSGKISPNMFKKKPQVVYSRPNNPSRIKISRLGELSIMSDWINAIFTVEDCQYSEEILYANRNHNTEDSIEGNFCVEWYNILQLMSVIPLTQYKKLLLRENNNTSSQSYLF